MTDREQDFSTINPDEFGLGAGNSQSSTADGTWVTTDPVARNLLNQLVRIAGDPDTPSDVAARLNSFVSTVRDYDEQNVAGLRLMVQWAESETDQAGSVPFVEELFGGIQDSYRRDLENAFYSLPTATQLSIAERLGPDATDADIYAAILPHMPKPGLEDVDPTGWRQARDWVAEITGLDVTRAGDLIDEYYRKTGQRDPYAYVQNEQLLEDAARMTIGNILPDAFYDETGTFYVNPAGVGPTPVGTPTKGPSIGTFPGIAGRATYPKALEEMYAEDPVEALFIQRRQGTARFPVVPSADIAYIMENERLRQKLLAGGGGGGGAAIKFDKEAIKQRILDRWQTLLLEAPQNLDQLVSKYMNSATAYGGQLNVDAWTTAEIHKTARYKMLYKQKPGHLSDDEYVNRYRGTTQQLGLPDQAALRESVAGLTSGASAAGFAERVSNVREAQVGNLGLLSRRFASTVSSLGGIAQS